MTNENFFEILGNIDDTFILEAREDASPVKSTGAEKHALNLRVILPIAAGVAALALVFVGLWKLTDSYKQPGTPTEVGLSSEAVTNPASGTGMTPTEYGLETTADIPSKEEFVQTSLADPDRHGVKQVNYTKSDLLQAWGEPDIQDNGYQAVWSAPDGKFIVVEFASDHPEIIEHMYASYTQDLVVLFSTDTLVYVSVRKDDVTDYSTCVMLPSEWLSPGTLDTDNAAGTILRIEFDGYFLETYPEQIGKPYSINTIGNVPDTELPALEELAQYIRDFFTGEQ